MNPYLSRMVIASVAAVLSTGCEASEHGLVSPYDAHIYSKIKVTDEVKLVTFSMSDPSNEQVLIEGHADGSLTRSGVVVGHVIGNAIYAADWHRLATVFNDDDVSIRGQTWRVFGDGRIDPQAVPGSASLGKDTVVDLGPVTTTMIGPEEGKKWIVRMTSNGYFTIAAWKGHQWVAMPIRAKGNGPNLARTGALLATTLLFTAPSSEIAALRDLPKVN